MEIDITHLVEEHDCSLLSGSVAELGTNAAKLTWDNCLNEVNFKPLLKTPENIAEARAYFKEFGAWDDLDSCPDSEIEALTIQYIAGTIREMESYDTFEEYEQAEIAGEATSGIFKHEGKFYFQLNH